MFSKLLSFFSENDKRDIPVYSGYSHMRRYLAAAKANEQVELGTPEYFMYCGFGGVLACGLTHALIVPLDLVKTRLQVDPGKYKSLIKGFKITVEEEGLPALYKGWSPTLIGYSLQGGFKFGLYEYFKHLYHDMVSEENAYLYRTYLYLVASASAEFFADIALSPFESTRVKIQTVPGYACNLRQALPRMYEEGGIGVFYKSLVPLWGRQIPYTMMKFASFERVLEILYKNVVPKKREDCTKGEQLVVTFAAGYIAGVFCAIVSHPADTIVSKMNKEPGTMIEIAKRVGFVNLWHGLGTRIIMIGTLTGLQWFIYDSFKVWMDLPRPPPPEMPESLKQKKSVK